MPHPQWPYSGQPPTTSNAERLIGRCLRQAALRAHNHQPEAAEAAQGEALTIESLRNAQALPDGFEPVLLPPEGHRHGGRAGGPKGAQPPSPVGGRWALSYAGLIGTTPAGAPRPVRVPHHLPGRFFFLAPDGAVRWGTHPRHSIPLGPAAQAKLEAQGATILRPPAAGGKQQPPARPILTLTALKAAF